MPFVLCLNLPMQTNAPSALQAVAAVLAELHSPQCDKVQALIEQLMQEWRIGDFAVAESIFKSQQRQLKQKGGAQMRKRMQVFVAIIWHAQSVQESCHRQP